MIWRFIWPMENFEIFKCPFFFFLLGEWEDTFTLPIFFVPNQHILNWSGFCGFFRITVTHRSSKPIVFSSSIIIQIRQWAQLIFYVSSLWICQLAVEKLSCKKWELPWFMTSPHDINLLLILKKLICMYSYSTFLIFLQN